MTNILTQHEKLLKAMKEKGYINSFVATYELRIKQAPTRILELKKMGFMIKSIPQGNGSVNWTLEAEPKLILKKKQDFVFKGNTAIPVENLVPEQRSFL
jgi:hypothetical protein